MKIYTNAIFCVFLVHVLFCFSNLVFANIKISVCGNKSCECGVKFLVIEEAKFKKSCLDRYFKMNSDEICSLGFF